MQISKTLIDPANNLILVGFTDGTLNKYSYTANSIGAASPITTLPFSDVN